MECPSCSAETRVLESRAAEAGAAVRRRRECKGCGRRFTSFERREREPAFVIKRDGERQPFNAEKLRAALGRAAHKRDRFVTPGDLAALVERIEFEIEQSGGEVAADVIREMCLDGLAALDTGAYLQFAGVELTDPDQVRAILDRQSRKDRDFSPLASVGSVRPEEDDPQLPPKRGSSKREEKV